MPAQPTLDRQQPPAAAAVSVTAPSTPAFRVTTLPPCSRSSCSQTAWRNTHRIPRRMRPEAALTALFMMGILFMGLVRAQLTGQGGTYAGYRVRQNCDPAGGTVENERISATMNFALCCERVGTGERCCNACLVRVCVCWFVFWVKSLSYLLAYSPPRSFYCRNNLPCTLTIHSPAGPSRAGKSCRKRPRTRLIKTFSSGTHHTSVGAVLEPAWGHHRQLCGRWRR